MKKLKPAALLFSLCAPLWSQTVALQCFATAEPALVRSEGMSESAGVIVLSCQSLTANTGRVQAALSVNLSTPMTNRLSGDGTVDTVLEVDKGFGPEPTGLRGRPAGNNGVIFESIDFPLPASRQVAFRISNIRAGGGVSESQVLAFLSVTGGSSMAIVNNPVRLAIARRSLAAAGVPARIECQTAPAVQNPTFSGLLGAGVKATTMRVTETQIASFESQKIGASNGTRIVVRYSGFPAGAHVFVPNLVAGSSQMSPTSAGDFGWTSSGGAVGELSTGLLLARVPMADHNGAGGMPLVAPGTIYGTSITLDEVTELKLSNGAVTVTYEVVNADPNLLECAQIPTFVCIPEGSRSGAIASATLSLGPVSTQNSASADAPIPRYMALEPPRDCAILGDCDLIYAPRLDVTASSTPMVALVGATAGPETELRIRNAGQGTLAWTAKVTYAEDAKAKNWLTVTPASGTGAGTVKLIVNLEGLEPGKYEAVLNIDAGAAGNFSRTIEFELRVDGAAPAGPPPPASAQPRLSSVGNTADPGVRQLVPGSLGCATGSNLKGEIAVSFDGIPAQIAGGDAGRVDFVVPEALLGKQTAQMRTTVNGYSADSRVVNIAKMAPAIFPRGVFNQDWGEHGENAAEQAGRVLQIFATGLPLPMDGVITAKVHDREIRLPVYAGEAPGFPGLQQVNVRIPDDLRPMDTDLWVCGIPLNDPLGRFCSLPVRIRISR